MEYSPSLGIQVEEEGMKYKDRGDPATPDFTKANFTIDEAWHELDLTSVIPTSANLVFFRFTNIEREIGPGTVKFREPDNVNELNATRKVTDTIVFQAMTKNGKVAYKVTGDEPNWNFLDLIIRGWIEG